MVIPDEMWKAEEAFRESVAREWVAQRLFWERRLRTASETVQSSDESDRTAGLKKAS